MSYTSKHLRLVQIVAILEKCSDDDSKGVPISEVASYLGYTPRHTDRLLRSLMKPTFDASRPWLLRAPKGGVNLTEQGWLMAASIKTAPYSTSEARRTQSWITRVRWPWRESDSKKRAVVFDAK